MNSIFVGCVQVENQIHVQPHGLYTVYRYKKNFGETTYFHLELRDRLISGNFWYERIYSRLIRDVRANVVTRYPLRHRIVEQRSLGLSNSITLVLLSEL